MNDVPVELAPMAARCLLGASRATDLAEFLRLALGEVRVAVGAASALLVRAEKGRWQLLGATDLNVALPTDLLADVLDQERPLARDEWLALPLAVRVQPMELLVVRQAVESRQRVAHAAATLEAALGAARDRQRQSRHVERLTAILAVVAQWRNTREMDTLLTKMAEAATRLLDAERASIFLWDKSTRTLVGRPALGVEGNELRIPDDAGIVGQVVQTGESRRVDEDEDQREINRKVDKLLNFRTRTLLCVPLHGAPLPGAPLKGAPLPSAQGALLGAFEMINKREGNFTDEDEEALVELAAHAALALQDAQEFEQLVRTRNQLADQAADGVKLIGGCPAIQALRSTIQRVADTELAVLILGENGTGKEVVSQQIHYLSRRRNEPLIAVNCAAIPESLLESELFGHEKGAFTDARDTRPGKFEVASGGTLFLDEIGDMSLAGQAKMLRVLEEKVIVRVGGSRPIHTDVRILAATNQNLAEMVRQRRFREDLYFRLTVVTVELPPLRQRGEDVIQLAEHFLRDFMVKAHRKQLTLTDAARRRLLGHPWPGNVRELRNLMERLAYLTSGDTIDVNDLAFILSPGDTRPADLPLDCSLAEATQRFQVQLIEQQIAAARGNMTEAARQLGLHRSNFYRKMRQLGMEVTGEE